MLCYLVGVQIRKDNCSRLVAEREDLFCLDELMAPVPKLAVGLSACETFDVKKVPWQDVLV